MPKKEKVKLTIAKFLSSSEFRGPIFVREDMGKKNVRDAVARALAKVHLSKGYFQVL